MAWFDTYEDNLDEDLGLAPTRGNQAVVQAPVAPIFQAPVAPAAPQGGVASLLGSALKPTNASVSAFAPLLDVTAPNQGQQEALRQQAAGGELTPQKIEELMRQASAPTPTQVFAPAAPPATTPTVHPYDALMNQVFGQDQTSLDDIINLTGKPPAQSPVAAPAPTAQAPVAQAPAQQGYSAFSGQLSPAFANLNFAFDTQNLRDLAAYEAQYGGNPETGTGGGSGINLGRPLMEAVETQDENGNWISQPTNQLDKRYGLTDTTGLVHGSQTVPIDKTHYKVTNAFFDPKTGQMVGQPIVGTYEQKQSASDKLTGLLMSAAMSAIAGPMAGALGGGALGAGLAGAALGGAGASVAGGDVLKGALTGGLGAGLGNVASGYINPAAAAAGQAVGGGTLGDIVSGAVKGAGTSATGALVGGKSIGDAILSGALGGGASAGIGSLVGQSGLPPELAKIAAPALTAAVLGKDPMTAALNSAIGQIIGAAKTGGDASSGGSEGVSTGMTGTTGAGQTLEDQLRAAGVDTGTEGTSTGINTGIFTGQNAGLTGQEGAGDEAEEGEEDEEDTGGETSAAKSSGSTTEQGANLIADLQKAGFTEQESGEDGEDTGAAKSSGNQTGNLEEDYKVSDKGDIVSSSGETGDFDPTTGEFQPYGSGLGKDLGTADQIIEGEGQKTDLDDLLDEINAGGSLAGGSDTTQSDEDILDSLLNSGYGNLDEDFVVTDRGTIKSTYTGEESPLDKVQVLPPEGSRGTGGTGGTSGTGGTGGTKTTTPSTPTTAQSGLDLNSLMALMALMGGEQQQAPQQQIFDLGQRKSLQDIFKGYFG